MGLLFADTTVAAENPGRCEFAELVADHVFGDVNRYEGFAVVDGEVVADKIRSDHRLAAPGFDRFAISTGVGNGIDLGQELLIDEWTFFQGTWHGMKSG